MARVTSKQAARRADVNRKIHELTEAALHCKSWGHEWEEDPSADWYTPRYEYINCYRFYLRCRRGCGSVKVAVYSHDGRWVTGFSRPPEANRIVGLGRGAGRRPFIQELIERQNVTPSGRKRSRGKDKAKTSRVTA